MGAGQGLVLDDFEDWCWRLLAVESAAKRPLAREGRIVASAFWHCTTAVFLYVSRDCLSLAKGSPRMVAVRVVAVVLGKRPLGLDRRYSLRRSS